MTGTRTFGAKDIRESTTPAQRELRAVEEEQARLKAEAGKKVKGQRPASKAKTEAPKKARRGLVHNPS